jgi:hypothetical protein
MRKECGTEEGERQTVQHTPAAGPRTKYAKAEEEGGTEEAYQQGARCVEEAHGLIRQRQCARATETPR